MGVKTLIKINATRPKANMLNADAVEVVEKLSNCPLSKRIWTIISGIKKRATAAGTANKRANLIVFSIVLLFIYYVWPSDKIQSVGFLGKIKRENVNTGCAIATIVLPNFDQLIFIYQQKN